MRLPSCAVRHVGKSYKVADKGSEYDLPLSLNYTTTPHHFVEAELDTIGFPSSNHLLFVAAMQL
jgi:hypothetical protein